jgi:hypothetical protein
LRYRSAVEITLSVPLPRETPMVLAPPRSILVTSYVA